MKRILLLVILLTVIFTAGWYFITAWQKEKQLPNLPSFPQTVTSVVETAFDDPLAIETLRKGSYPGSDFDIDQTLAPGSNYKRYIASYEAEGNTIYGLLTIPDTIPEGGAPAILFIHGHLDPDLYQTTERYVAYQDGFAKSGYVTFKPDLRGHGRSEGEDVNSNFSNGYIVDSLNAISTLKRYPVVNPQKIGMWGHSMGGGITLRTMVVSKDIKAGIMWAGVVGDYNDLIERYRRRIPWLPTNATPSAMQIILEKHGNPSGASEFWQAVDPYNYLDEISGPVQLHHGTGDDSVPHELSQHLRDALVKAGKEVEYYEYPGADHNLSQPFATAMQRSISFYDKYLK